MLSAAWGKRSAADDADCPAPLHHSADIYSAEGRTAVAPVRTKSRLEGLLRANFLAISKERILICS